MNTGRDYHIFEMHGDTLLCLPSGEVFILDGLAMNLINSGASNSEEAVLILGEKHGVSEVEKAFKEMESILSSPVKDHRDDSIHRELRALCLNITHRCNLACEYCFARGLTEKDAKSMTREVVRGALDFLFRESGSVNRLQVDFFGGEPLMSCDLVKEGFAYARSLEKGSGKRVLFTLTTNATLLDEEIIDFIKQNNISLVLSLDGRIEINDRYRKFRDGRGSGAAALANIRKVKASLDRNDYYIRGTFTSDTMDILNTLEFYAGEGFYNVSLEPVSAGEDAPYALNENHLEALSRSYADIAMWMLDKDMKFFHFNLEMDNPLCLTRRITGCGAGVEYMAVDPDGNLYPCHQFVGNNKFIIGNVFKGIKSRDILNRFREATIYAKKGCDKCWARFYCSGGCHFQQFSISGDILTPSKFYCELFKKRLEAALWYNTMRRISGSLRQN